MADWLTLAFVHAMIGFEADVLGLLSFSSGWSNTRALLIIAFLLYAIASVLMVFTKMADLANSMAVSLTVIISLFLAAFLLVIGVAVRRSEQLNPYSATLEISAALLAILAGIFLVMTLVGGGSSKTTPAS